jgi:hypothetical protein
MVHVLAASFPILLYLYNPCPLLVPWMQYASVPYTVQIHTRLSDTSISQYNDLVNSQAPSCCLTSSWCSSGRSRCSAPILATCSRGGWPRSCNLLLKAGHLRCTCWTCQLYAFLDVFVNTSIQYFPVHPGARRTLSLLYASNASEFLGMFCKNY